MKLEDCQMTTRNIVNIGLYSLTICRPLLLSLSILSCIVYGSAG